MSFMAFQVFLPQAEPLLIGPYTFPPRNIETLPLKRLDRQGPSVGSFRNKSFLEAYAQMQWRAL